MRQDMAAEKDTRFFLNSKEHFTDASKTTTLEWTTHSKRLHPIDGVFHDPRLTDTGELKSLKALGLPKGLELFCPKTGAQKFRSAQELMFILIFFHQTLKKYSL